VVVDHHFLKEKAEPWVGEKLFFGEFAEFITRFFKQMDSLVVSNFLAIFA